jgi:hypothetical protein
MLTLLTSTPTYQGDSDYACELLAVKSLGLTVPIRPFLSGEAFEPETIREMSLALESVCKTLGLKVIDDPATRHVAQKIIELSQHGVRGVATLHAMTVKEFQDE